MKKNNAEKEEITEVIETTEAFESVETKEITEDEYTSYTQEINTPIEKIETLEFSKGDKVKLIKCVDFFGNSLRSNLMSIAVEIFNIDGEKVTVGVYDRELATVKIDNIKKI